MHFGFWRPGQLLAAPFADAPSIPIALLACGVFGYGLAVLCTLISVNWRRFWTVLRPTWGKVLGATALMAVTPVAVFSWIPWIVGGLMGFVVLSGPDAALWIVLVCSIGTAIWYPISALIVSGTRSRWVRFGLYCLMFWSGYAAHILHTGVQVFRL